MKSQVDRNINQKEEATGRMFKSQDFGIQTILK